jgi:putative transposase
MKKHSMHRPPHIYLDDRWYFITAHTYNQLEIFHSSKHQDLWLRALFHLAPEFRIFPFAWVLLWDHYHLLIHVEKSLELPKFIQRFHGSTAFSLNQNDKARGRTVWYNYWDHCIREERDLWTRFNYIHHNPVKHRYVKAMKEWELSSYSNFVQEYGQTWMDNVLSTYPVIDFSFEDGKTNYFPN